MTFYQGDVQLKRIEKLPKNLKEKDKTIAYGEATGHHHSFTPESKVKVMIDNSGNQFAILEQQSELVHQEHNTIQIPKGIWRIRRQREYDQIEGIRQVSD